MVTNQILLLSVIISALFLGTFQFKSWFSKCRYWFLLWSSWWGSLLFWEKTRQCAIASRDDSMAENPCYGED